MKKQFYILMFLLPGLLFADSTKSKFRTLQSLTIPPRAADAMTGSEFMQSVLNMPFAEREVEIFNEISSGNIPDFLRQLIPIENTFTDANGNEHTLQYEVMPDYLAIGSNENFCRIPMGPITAQRLADLFGAVMPTRKLVDNIYENSTVKLAPVTYTPVGNQNELVPKFVEHNTAIEQQRLAAGGTLGELTGGTKKDVVLSNKIIDPNRTHHVVIYGWHRLNGIAIQPLYNGHINTYVDYSHGIRFLNSKILLDGEIKGIQEILSDPILYKLLSDESGRMEQPSYLAANSLAPEMQKSFGVISEGEAEIKIIIEESDTVDSYLIYLSEDGVNFDQPISSSSNIVSVTNLIPDQIYFIKIAAVNSHGTSLQSEVLSIVNSNQSNQKYLIVNGFDRSSDGNTRNFVRQHSVAMQSNNIIFESATNDAVISGLINLENYFAVDYILGDESTADETFSTTEQTIIKSYLQQGGNLFVSGSEIAWDLDYKGSASDKNFIHNFLKMKYVADAPNNISGTYYQASVTQNSIFSGIPSFFFDNGTHGTINVKWPDVIKNINGSQASLLYNGFDTTYGAAGINFNGTFPNGTNEGSIIALGIPFESIYPETVRDSLMSKINMFFGLQTGINVKTNENLLKFELYQNYPNPFNQTTLIKYSIHQTSDVIIKVYDLIGKEVTTLLNETKSPGKYSVEWNGKTNYGQRISSGVYFYTLQAGSFFESKKMILIK